MLDNTEGKTLTFITNSEKAQRDGNIEKNTN